MASERYEAILQLRANVQEGLASWEQALDQAVRKSRTAFGELGRVGVDPAQFHRQGRVVGEAMGQGLRAGLRQQLGGLGREIEALARPLGGARGGTHEADRLVQSAANSLRATNRLLQLAAPLALQARSQAVRAQLEVVEGFSRLPARRPVLARPMYPQGLSAPADAHMIPISVRGPQGQIQYRWHQIPPSFAPGSLGPGGTLGPRPPWSWSGGPVANFQNLPLGGGPLWRGNLPSPALQGPYGPLPPPNFRGLPLGGYGAWGPPPTGPLPPLGPPVGAGGSGGGRGVAGSFFQSFFRGGEGRGAAEQAANLGRIAQLTLLYNAIFKLTQAVGQAVSQFLELERAVIEFEVSVESAGGGPARLADEIQRLSAAAGQAPAAGLEAARRGVATFTEQIRAGQTTAADVARISAQQATRAAVLTNQEVSVSTDEIQTVTKAFNLSVGGQPAVLDAVTNAYHRFGTSQQTILQGMERGAQVAQTAGFSYEELAGIIGLVSRETGRQGTDIAQGLGRILQNMRLPEVRAQLGQFIGDDVFKSSSEQLAALARIWPTLGESAQASIIRSLGGAEIQNTFQALMQNFEELGSFAQENGQKAGAAMREFDKLMSSVGGTVKRIGADLQRLFQSIANSGVADPFFLLLDTIDPILRGVNAILDVFNLLPRPLRTTLFALLEIGLALKVLSAAQRAGGVGGVLGQSAGLAGAIGGMVGNLRAAAAGQRVTQLSLLTQIAAGWRGQSILQQMPAGFIGPAPGFTPRTGGWRGAYQGLTRGFAGTGPLGGAVPAVAVAGGLALVGGLVTAYQDHERALKNVTQAEKDLATAFTADEINAALAARENASQELQSSLNNPLTTTVLGFQALAAVIYQTTPLLRAFGEAIPQLPGVGRWIEERLPEDLNLGQRLAAGGRSLVGSLIGSTLLPGLGLAVGPLGEYLRARELSEDQANKDQAVAEARRREADFLAGRPKEQMFKDLAPATVSADLEYLASAGYTATARARLLNEEINRRDAEAAQRAADQFRAGYVPGQEGKGGRGAGGRARGRAVVPGSVPYQVMDDAAAGEYIRQILELAPGIQAEKLAETGDKVAAAEAKYNLLLEAEAKTQKNDHVRRRQLKLARLEAMRELEALYSDRAQSEGELAKSLLPQEANVARAEQDLYTAEAQLFHAEATGDPDRIRDAQTQVNNRRAERDAARRSYQAARRLRQAGLHPIAQLVARRDNALEVVRRLGATPEGRQSDAYENAILEVQQLALQIAEGKIDIALNLALAGIDPRAQTAVIAAQLKAARAKLAAQRAAGTDTSQTLREIADLERQAIEASLERHHQYALTRIDNTNPVQVAREEERAALAALRAAQRAGAGAEVTNPLRNAYEDARQARLHSAFSQRLSDTQIAEELGRISHGTYIRYLQSEHDRLTREIALTKANTEGRRRLIDERNQIDLALKAAKEELTGQWNIGEIDLPTPYEVRRYIKTQAAGAPYGANYQMQNNRYVDYPGMAAATAGLSIGTNNVSININGANQAAVARTVIAAVRGELRTAAAATGTRGRRR